MADWLEFGLLCGLIWWIIDLKRQVRMYRKAFHDEQDQQRAYRNAYSNLVNSVKSHNITIKKTRLLIRHTYRVSDVALLSMFGDEGFKLIKKMRAELQVRKPKK